MKKVFFAVFSTAISILCMPGALSANDHNDAVHVSHGGSESPEHQSHDTHHKHNHSGPPVPPSMMSDHVHGKGEWMVSYRFMRMEMEGNRDGTDSLSPSEISGEVPNRFAGVPGQPATLRIVPTEMTMDMHMLGFMAKITDWATLMIMGNYIEKEMDHITFSGADPNLELGRFTTSSSGIGDTKLSLLFQPYNEGQHKLVVKAGLSLPTGSIDEEDTILAPNNMNMRVRLPYAMQLGSGTYDLEPAVTYSGHSHKFGWGSQARAVIRTGRNNEGYTLGDKLSLTGWGSYAFTSTLSSSLGLTAETEDSIQGIDSEIVGPVQTADPRNYGGERVSAEIGFTYTGQNGWMEGHSLSAGFILPVYQDLNGPQMERDYSFLLGYRKAF